MHEHEYHEYKLHHHDDSCPDHDRSTHHNHPGADHHGSAHHHGGNAITTFYDLTEHLDGSPFIVIRTDDHGDDRTPLLSDSPEYRAAIERFVRAAVRDNVDLFDAILDELGGSPCDDSADGPAVPVECAPASVGQPAVFRDDRDGLRAMRDACANLCNALADFSYALDAARDR